MIWSRSSAGVRPCRAAASRVRGCNGNSTGRPSLLSSSRMAWRRCGSSVFSGRWIVARTYSPGSAPRPAAMARAVASSGAISCRGFDDRVASQQDAVIGHALATQVPDGLLGGRAVQVGQDADDAPVQFLGHGPVVGSQACLHVHDGGTCVVRRLRGRGGGICVALDQNRRWWLLREERPQMLDHPADLGVSRLPADPVQDLRLREGALLLRKTPESSASVCWPVCRKRAWCLHHWIR